MATYDLASSIPASSSLRVNDILNCSYTGNYKSITLPQGTYKLECWGAQGIYSSASPTGSTENKLGGYAKGTITLSSPTTFYIYVGGKPGSNINGSASNYNGGWNGGGGKPPASNYNDNGPGGGATDICLVASDCTLTNYAYIRTSASYLSRIIVAGGGGGGRSSNAQSRGGYAPTETVVSNYNGGMTSGGTTASNSLQAAAFGYGASTNNTSDDCGCGGGGWYGGGSNGDSYGGGGSSFVWCDTYASYVPSGYTPSANLKMTDVELTPNIRSGDGYIKITVLSVVKDWTITYNANGGSSTPATQTVAQGSSVTLASAISRTASSTTFILTGNGNGSGSNTSKTATQSITYSFAKWNTNSSGSGTDYTAGGTITPSTNLTLYARWNSTISYTGNRVCDIPIPNRPNYTFTGWNTKADGTGVAYSATSTTTFTSATTLYAQWQEIIQYIPYIYNGSNWVKYEIRTNNGTNFNNKYKGSIYL